VWDSYGEQHLYWRQYYNWHPPYIPRSDMFTRSDMYHTHDPTTPRNLGSISPPFSREQAATSATCSPLRSQTGPRTQQLGTSATELPPSSHSHRVRPHHNLSPPRPSCHRHAARAGTYARAPRRTIVLRTHIRDTPDQPRSTGLAQADTQGARKRVNNSQPEVPEGGGDQNHQNPEHLALDFMDGHAVEFSFRRAAELRHRHCIQQRKHPWSAIDTAAAGHSTHDPPPEKYGSAPSALRTCPPGARTLRPPCGCGGTAGAAPWPGSSPIRGVGGLCTDATGAAAPHWLRPTWQAGGRAASKLFTADPLILAEVLVQLTSASVCLSGYWICSESAAVDLYRL
jgi:hypothetical protein